ncbi:acyl-CoA desaturase [Sorangium sp. So ce1078]|uniref:acyl-CoA desaturase n=1 Tax=Sorangium sp. So ce1078 TaxID=3133329 RepID=UPI003F5F7373
MANSKLENRSVRSERLRSVQRRLALPTILIPSIGVIVALVQVFTTGVGAMELWLFLGMYLLSMIGISVGWHRYLAHRSFQAKRPLRALFAILGSMGAQGPVINWVSNHRRHHAHSDQIGDPHSPNITDDGRPLGGFRGFWHAHIGWMLGGDVTNAVQYSKDLLRDPMIKTINQLYPLWVLLSLLIPTALGGLIRGTLAGAFQGFIWGGLVQIAVNQHATWTIASLAHIFGSRPYYTGEFETSRNNFLVAIPILGDGWHNNHHAFPNVAICGFEWWQIDPSGWVIRGLEKIGLVYEVRGVPSESMRQARRRKPGGEPRLDPHIVP